MPAIAVTDGVKGGACAKKFGFTPMAKAWSYVRRDGPGVGDLEARREALGTGLTWPELRGMGVPEALTRRLDPSKP